MNAPAHVYLDVSYTRIQHGNVGITRTVRRLAAELATLASCTPVAWHSDGFRSVQGAMEAAPAGAAPRGWAARLFGFAHSPAVRRVAAMLPVALVRRGWAAVNALTFNRLSARDRPAAFAPGDVLLLADEAWNYPAWRAAGQARRKGARVVLVVYDLIPLRQPQFCPPLFAHVFGRWLPRMLARSDAVLCISGATEKDLRAWCSAQGLPVPPTAHFRLGSDLPQGSGPVREALSRFAGEDGPFFLAVGTIEPRKNLALLLDAFERLWQEGSDARLLVAGRPHPQCAGLVARLRGHAQQGRKLLALFDATDAELGLAYGCCRALVFPSLAEGFGLPLVEARVRGCPVIASDLPALAELADAGVFLFPAGDEAALLARLREHAARDRRAEAGSMPAFTWNDSARQLLRVTGHLLGAPWKT
jgi:glycosyltransferase involved in cell wall biosynthesis